MEQVPVERQKQHEEELEEAEVKNLRNEELDADIDSILDEIDSVLEENAEEFVGAYIQKGGE